MNCSWEKEEKRHTGDLRTVSRSASIIVGKEQGPLVAWSRAEEEGGEVWLLAGAPAGPLLGVTEASPKPARAAGVRQALQETQGSAGDQGSHISQVPSAPGVSLDHKRRSLGRAAGAPDVPAQPATEQKCGNALPAARVQRGKRPAPAGPRRERSPPAAAYTAWPATASVSRPFLLPRTGPG